MKELLPKAEVLGFSSTNIGGFVEELENIGVITSSQRENIQQSNSDDVIRNTMKLFGEIELGFWSPMILLGAYTGRDITNILGSPSLNTDFIIFCLSATTLRGGVSYWRGSRRGISDPGIFALLEIIPWIGRFAPVVWLPEHRDYIIIKLLQKKYKNKCPTPEELGKTFVQYQNSIVKLSILYTMMKKISRKVGSLLS